MHLILLVVLAALTLPAIVFAGPVLRNGESVSVAADQTIDGDFYAFGGTVTISGNATEDVYVMGGTVTINGNVGGDLTVLGGTVQLHGSVADDIRVIGGDITIAESAGGDVVVLGGALTMLSTAKTEGDILFAVGNAVIESDLAGSLWGAAETVRTDSHVGGEVRVQAARLLTLGSKAGIAGNVTYSSASELERAPEAFVGGVVVKETLQSGSDSEQGFRLPVFSFLILLFSALVLFLIARGRLEVLTERTLNEYGRQGLIGLGVLVFAPILALLLITSILGIVVGGTLAFLYIAVLFLTWVTSAITLGVIIMRALGKDTRIHLMTVLVGSAAYILIGLIPYVGPLVLSILYVMVLGGYGVALYRFAR
jgi:cytoskeletal protein CcmA (bactofilin family)